MLHRYKNICLLGQDDCCSFIVNLFSLLAQIMAGKRGQAVNNKLASVVLLYRFVLIYATK
jgi:hypothetical protein